MWFVLQQRHSHDWLKWFKSNLNMFKHICFTNKSPSQASGFYVNSHTHTLPLPEWADPHTVSSPTTGNCAHFHKGGWWYNACGQANLNGVWYSGGVYRSKFQDGIFWADYGGGFYSMKSVRMMIRPIDWWESVSPTGAGAAVDAGVNLNLFLNCDCIRHLQLFDPDRRTSPMEKTTISRDMNCNSQPVCRPLHLLYA